MYYFKRFTLNFDFKVGVPNQPKRFKFPKKNTKTLNIWHSTRNGSKVTCGFIMKR